ncbi:MAG TPA: hypothetical protein VJN42_07840 [Candidatus Acidoferrum sp.]|nr:hypothetical protein [Candidatus Acidoferrum sp.]
MRFHFSIIAATLSGAALLGGCAPVDSVFPLYKPEDTAFENRLVGTWEPVVKDANSSENEKRWICSHARSDRFYDFKWTAVGRKGGFVAKARLVQLGNNLFIDFEGDDSGIDEETDNLAAFPAVTTHMIGRIWLTGDVLQIHFLSDDWVKKQVKAGTFPLASLDAGNGPLLTASTDALRKFMEAHAEDSEALSENFEFTRSK